MRRGTGTDPRPAGIRLSLGALVLVPGLAGGLPSAAAAAEENVDSIVAGADTAAPAALSAPEAEAEERPAVPALWLEAYAEAVHSRHEDGNLAGFADWKVGKRLPGPLRADVYAKARVYRDRAGFYWNNRADAGIGARAPILRKYSLTAFAEATWGRYLGRSAAIDPSGRLRSRSARLGDSLAAAREAFYKGIYTTVFDANSSPDPKSDRAALDRAERQGEAVDDALVRLAGQIEALDLALDTVAQSLDSLALVPEGAVTEFKAGLVFWHGWGGADGDTRPSAWFAFPFRPWGEIYADCIYSSLSREVLARGTDGAYRDSTARFRNLIAYANPSVGFLAMDGKLGSAAVFVGGYAWFDTHRDWWNNLAMAGPGLKYTPLRGVDLAVKAEWLWGAYYGRERAEDPNPYAERFSDARVTLGFWHGLGM